MVINILLLSIAFIALIIGTITDIKTREVPDWINYSLIFSGIGLRALYSSITLDWSFLIQGITGLIVFVILGYIMFYAGQWGGGDSKMIMGLGALLGLNFTLQPFPLILVFLINVLLVGAVYGIIYSIALAIKHRKAFVKNTQKMLNSEKMRKFRKIKLVLLIILILPIIYMLKSGMITIPISLSLLGLLIIAYMTFYLFVFIKAIELSAMLKSIPPEKLTEGDWIAKDVIIDGKKIVGPKDLGIEKEQIRQLIAFKKKRKLSKILIKEGIPFVPSFLIAFIISLSFGGWWMILF